MFMFGQDDYGSASGAVAPDKPGGSLRRDVRVTGIDGDAHDRREFVKDAIVVPAPLLHLGDGHPFV
jgi:hypothetical protein